MAQTKNFRILQSVLLLVWITIVLLDLSVPVQSQGCLPPLVTPGYLYPPNPALGSWKPAIGNVKVKIEGSFGAFAFDATTRIEDGQRKWNNTTTCSFVNFAPFETVSFTPQDLLAPAPFGEVHWEIDMPSQGYNAETLSDLGDFGVESATIKVRPDLVVQNSTYFNYLGSHEIGHTFNLNDCISTTTPACFAPGLTIMGPHTNTALDAQGPTSCDFAAVANIYCPSTPTPTPTPTPSPTPANQDECESINWFWNPFADSCQSDPPPSCELLPEVCENGIWSFQWCGCIPYNTPILVDVAGDGFALTSSAVGVSFNLNNVGGNERLAWTSPSDDDGWLVLDRNGNGMIENGTELFGDVTPQPKPPAGSNRNGFRALAEYDKPGHGGNGDGEITQTDAIFSRLGLWQDTNHDGVFESHELRTLSAAGISSLELDYREYKKTDVYGNAFRYRAKVKNVQGQQLGRWAWDVILVKASP